MNDRGMLTIKQSDIKLSCMEDCICFDIEIEDDNGNAE